MWPHGSDARGKKTSIVTGSCKSNLSTARRSAPGPNRADSSSSSGEWLCAREKKPTTQDLLSSCPISSRSASKRRSVPERFELHACSSAKRLSVDPKSRENSIKEEVLSPVATVKWPSLKREPLSIKNSQLDKCLLSPAWRKKPVVEECGTEDGSSSERMSTTSSPSSSRPPLPQSSSTPRTPSLAQKKKTSSQGNSTPVATRKRSLDGVMADHWNDVMTIQKVVADNDVEGTGPVRVESRHHSTASLSWGASSPASSHSSSSSTATARHTPKRSSSTADDVNPHPSTPTSSVRRGGAASRTSTSQLHPTTAKSTSTAVKTVPVPLSSTGSFVVPSPFRAPSSNSRRRTLPSVKQEEEEDSLRGSPAALQISISPIPGLKRQNSSIASTDVRRHLEGVEIERRASSKEMDIEMTQSVRGAGGTVAATQNLVDLDDTLELDSAEEYVIEDTQGMVTDSIYIPHRSFHSDPPPPPSPPRRQLSRRKLTGLAGRLSSYMSCLRSDRMVARRDPLTNTNTVEIKETNRAFGLFVSEIEPTGQLIFSRDLPRRMRQSTAAPVAASSASAPQSADSAPSRGGHAPSCWKLALPLPPLVQIASRQPPAILNPLIID